MNTINWVHQFTQYEQGYMDQEDVIEFFQELLDTGMIYNLQGSYQRTAQALYNAGEIH